MMNSAFTQSLFDRFGVSPLLDWRIGTGLNTQNLCPPQSPSFSTPHYGRFHLGLYKGPLRGPSGILPYLSPFHHHGHFSVYECPFEPAFIQKRNERERHRVKCVNQGYAKLRDHLPGQSADKRLSKVETLRAAIRYIKYLQRLVEMEEEGHEEVESIRGSLSVPDRGGETPAC